MSQVDWEVSFWKGELLKGADAFLAQRKEDWEDHLRKFPELGESKGEILEVGTGLVSVFEFSEKECKTIDPLQDIFSQMYRKPDAKVTYLSDWDTIEPDSFDEILCVNVVDHTPDPEYLLDRIKTALKPGGKFYFQVNFDNSLSPAHYGLWDMQKVDSFMKGWTALIQKFEERPTYNQTRYWAVYICPEKQASSSQATSLTKKSPVTKKSASTQSKRTRTAKTSSLSS